MALNDRWIRLGGACGIALVVIYITTTVVGAALRPGYSHIRDSVSELIEVGAPNKAPLDTMLFSYHMMLMMFAYGLHLALPHTRRGWLGPTLLGVTGFLGIILTAFFPCDVGCEANPTTLWGKGHGVIVAISALFVFTGMVALTWRMYQNPAWSPYARYTLVSALAMLCLGLATIPLLNTDYTGLAERFALAPLYLWFVVIGRRLWRSSDSRWTAP